MFGAKHKPTQQERLDRRHSCRLWTWLLRGPMGALAEHRAFVFGPNHKPTQQERLDRRHSCRLLTWGLRRPADNGILRQAVLCPRPIGRAAEHCSGVRGWQWATDQERLDRRHSCRLRTRRRSRPADNGILKQAVLCLRPMGTLAEYRALVFRATRKPRLRTAWTADIPVGSGPGCCAAPQRRFPDRLWGRAPRLSWLGAG